MRITFPRSFRTREYAVKTASAFPAFAVLLRHVVVVRVDDFGVYLIQHSRLAQRFHSGGAVGGEFRFCDGDPQTKPSEILNPIDWNGGRRHPQGSTRHRHRRWAAGGEQALPVEFLHVFRVGGEERVEGSAVLNLLRELGGGSETEYRVNPVSGFKLRPEDLCDFGQVRRGRDCQRQFGCLLRECERGQEEQTRDSV